MSASPDPLGVLRADGRLGRYGGTSDDPEARKGGWLASVAVILRDAGPSPDLLLIERAEAEHDPWSGHMALPGGRREEGDASLLHTAMRETREEIGLDLEHEGEAVGRLDLVEPESTRLPILTVLPFVFAVPGGTSVVSLSDEVARALWVPLGHFRGDERRTSHRIRVQGAVLTFPAFSVGDRVVWGLTRRIVDDLLSRLD